VLCSFMGFYFISGSAIPTYLTEEIEVSSRTV
jgi:hypothetical protein